MKHLKNDFPSRLRSLRIEKNMTQDELAKKLDVTRSTVTNWESGTRFPRNSAIREMAVIFGVPVDYLTGSSNHKYNINIPDYFEMDLTKLNSEGLFMIREAYKLLINSADYRK